MNKKDINIGMTENRDDSRQLSKILVEFIKESDISYSFDINERLRKYSINVKHLEYSLKRKKYK